jgi:hypothetical protein
LKDLVTKLGGVDFPVIPDHGDMSDTGFFMKDAIEHCVMNICPNGGKQLMCLISSNPEKGKYYMLRQIIQYSFFSNL